MAGARAFVFPTRDEGFGLPVLEALRCGIPVICSDLPVLREVGGRFPRYVPVDDVEAWASALVDTGTQSTIMPGSDAAAARWASTFTWQRCAGITAAAYREAASA